MGEDKTIFKKNFWYFPYWLCLTPFILVFNYQIVNLYKYGQCSYVWIFIPVLTFMIIPFKQSKYYEITEEFFIVRRKFFGLESEKKYMWETLEKISLGDLSVSYCPKGNGRLIGKIISLGLGRPFIYTLKFEKQQDRLINHVQVCLNGVNDSKSMILELINKINGMDNLNYYPEIYTSYLKERIERFLNRDADLQEKIYSWLVDIIILIFILLFNIQII